MWKFRGKGQILWSALKFHSLQKMLGPINDQYDNAYYYEITINVH